MKPKRQKRQEAIVRMQKQIERWYAYIRAIEVSSPPLINRNAELLTSKDKIKKLETCILFTERKLVGF